jgi:hypothetical protein
MARMSCAPSLFAADFDSAKVVGYGASFFQYRQIATPAIRSNSIALETEVRAERISANFG